jgi:hypothetical protein
MVEKLGRSAQELQGKSYFDKIIQVPFTMPSGSYRIDKYIMSLLGWNYTHDNKSEYERIDKDRERFFLASCRANRISKKDIDYFTNITALTVGHNPRSIKRAINYANLLRMVVQKQWSAKNITGKRKEWTISDAMMLYPLACMQLAWPELFIYFADEPNPTNLSLMQDFDYLQNLKGMDALFKRVHNPDETLSNITGFIDEFIGLVDKDGDGQISREEFKPIWQMMIDSNMTSSKYRDIEEEWNKLKAKIFQQMGDNEDPVLVDKVLRLFRDEHSQWSNRHKFGLLEAGRWFYNVTWCRRQIGSIASTRSQPFQFYLKGSYDLYCEALPEDIHRFLVDVRTVGHYGTGDTRVEILEIAKKSDCLDTMNKILNSMEKQILKI